MAMADSMGDDPSMEHAAGGHSTGFNECVHCGFCLPVCPTYDVLGTEMDSPRGRLALMGALETGRIAATDPVVRHLDLCLGCRACESECPSGVPFGAHLQRTRERLRAGRSGLREWLSGGRLLETLILRVVGLPAPFQRAATRLLGGFRRYGLADFLARPKVSVLLPSRVSSGLGLLVNAPLRSAALPAVIAAEGKPKLRAGFLEGCVSRWLFGDVNRAAGLLLSRAGCEVVTPRSQRCCGALHAHAGDLEGARRLARANIEAFESAGRLDAIVVAAAGCGSAMKEYPSLFEGQPHWRGRAELFASKVKDALELLVEIGAPPLRREVRASVAYHDACHLAHAQGIRAQPRALLAAVPGLTLIPLADADRCCGSAGIYNVLHPEVAAEILRGKIQRLRASGASVVAAANPGCLLQIAAGAREAGLAIRAVHPLVILEEASRNPE